MRLTRAVIRSPALTGVVYRPSAPGPHPGVVVLGGSDGGAPEAAAAALARSGFVALALAYFGVPPLPGRLREISVEYCVDAVGWLARQNAVHGTRVALLARSRGTELALLTATRTDEVAGVVGYAPSNVAWQAPPRDPFRPERPVSSWSVGGVGVPFVRSRAPEHGDVTGGRVRFRPSFERALASAPGAAAIPVERIAGPVLLISGGNDETWPACEMAERLLDRLARHGHRYDGRHLRFPRAGHLIGVPGAAATAPAGAVLARLDTGGSADQDADASSRAWEPVTGFLTNLLGAPRLTNSRR